MNELIRKYRNKEFYSLNCAEAMVYSANEYYQLGLTEDALKMAAGFGGGIFEKHLCGIVSGAVAVLGVIFKGKMLDDKNLLEITVNDFKENFRQKYYEIDCQYLVDHYKSEETGCNDIIFESANILMKVIDKYKI